MFYLVNIANISIHKSHCRPHPVPLIEIIDDNIWISVCIVIFREDRLAIFGLWVNPVTDPRFVLGEILSDVNPSDAQSENPLRLLLLLSAGD